MSEPISDFVGITVVEDTGLLNVVQNGQNFKIPQSDYLAQLGVSGSIVQEGDPIAVPVLDVQGTVNNIRNIEASVGVSAAVSAQNGVELKTALLPSGEGGGVETLFNETTAPQFRCLTAGAGINVAQSGNCIQISTSGVPASTKTVLVSSVSDFPTPVVGVITLEPDTEYFLQADISTTNTFVLQANTVLAGPDILIGKLTYTGVGIMITAVDATCKVRDMQMLCTAGTFCDVSNTAGNEGTSTFIMDRVVVAANIGGNLTSIATHQVLQCSLTFITDGFDYLGTNWSTLNWDGFVCTQLAGKMVDLGAITFNRPQFLNFSLTLSGGTFAISGALSSGNINAGGIGAVISGRVMGAGTLLENISVDDDLWTFFHNDEEADTHPDGLLSMQANAVATVITTQSVPVLLAGVWVVESASQSTGTTAGRITYNGGKPAKLPIITVVTIEPVSGGAQLMGASIAINGTVVPNSLRTATTSAGNPISITVPWQKEMDAAEFYEVWVSNESGTTNVLGSSATLMVN